MQKFGKFEVYEFQILVFTGIVVYFECWEGENWRLDEAENYLSYVLNLTSLTELL